MIVGGKKRAFGALALACAMSPFATVARAAAGPEAGGDRTEVVLFFVAIIAGAYVLAHWVVDRLQGRFLVISGVEYLLLGALLAAFVNAFRDMTSLFPIIALAAGWVGLLRGTDFDIATLRRSHPATARVVLLHHLIPGVVVALVAYRMIADTITDNWAAAAPAAAVLGCCAAADSAEPIELLGRRYEIGNRIAPLLRQATRLGDILIILAFGVVFCFFREESPDAAVQLGPAAWMWVMVLLGVFLGLLFQPFVGGDESDNARFLALVGIIAFASGAAYFLELSSLTLNLILGIILVNFARGGHLVHSTLESTQRPMSLVLLVFAGALWVPTPLVPTLVGTTLFVSVRLLSKAFGSLLAGWGKNIRSDLFRGLLAQGDVTVAMAVSYRLVFDGPAAQIAYSVVLGSVVFHDVVAPRVLRGLLVDEGDVQRELKASVPAEAG